MPPTSYEPGPNGERPMAPGLKQLIRYGAMGAVMAILTTLALYAMLSPSSAPAGIPTVQPDQPTAAILPTLSLPTWTPQPGQVAPPAQPPPAALVAAEPTPNCPPAQPLPDGTSAGWLARAAGCPSVVLANVAGERRWVQRPASLADDLLNQLPEVAP